MNVRRSYGPIDTREQGPGGVYDSGGGGGGGGGDHPRGSGGGPVGTGETHAYKPPAGAPGASPAGGPAGVGGTGGYGFVNLGQYLYANPNTTGQYAPNPGGGATVSNAGPGGTNAPIGNANPNGAVAYGATGAYTAGMAGVDNALNSVYGRVNAGMGGAPSGGSGHSGGGGRVDPFGGGAVEGGGGGNSHTSGPVGQQRQRGFGSLGGYFNGGY